MFEMVYLFISLSEPHHHDRNREYTMIYLFLTNETAQFLFLAVWDILVSTREWDKNVMLPLP